MEFRLPFLFLCFIFSIVSWGSHADQTLSPEMYWKQVLPNTPMPKAILDSLHPGWMDNKGTSVTVDKGGVGAHTGKPSGHGSVHYNPSWLKSTPRPWNYADAYNPSWLKSTPRPWNYADAYNPSWLKSTPRPWNYADAYNKFWLKSTPRPWNYADAYNPSWLKGTPRPWSYADADAQLRKDPNLAIFFLQKDLKPGNKMTLDFPRLEGGAAFVPRRTASSVPFSSAEFPTILRRFPVSPGSVEAAAMKQTILDCERKDVVAGEEKYCPTSLESMVDFAVSKLRGRSLTALSTDAAADDGRTKEFSVTAVREVRSSDVVACHKEPYPYAVFYCHKTKSTVVYTVELAAEGKVVEAPAVCHKDTAAWNPKFLAFQLLKVKPGSVPICHFLAQGTVMWVRN